ncbi:hypothetical protein DXG01_011816 [Tephrocybe rancida]|nr:hypothetical protein DXG01_011816 [Tephrocybe rancida]
MKRVKGDVDSSEEDSGQEETMDPVAGLTGTAKRDIEEGPIITLSGQSHHDSNALEWEDEDPEPEQEEGDQLGMNSEDEGGPDEGINFQAEDSGIDELYGDIDDQDSLSFD